MKKHILIIVACAGIFLSLYPAQRITEPISIPNIGWTPDPTAPNLVKVHESTDLYICKTPLLGGIGVLPNSVAVGFGGAQSMCAFAVSLGTQGWMPATGSGLYLTGASFFQWQPFNGTIPTNVLGAGIMAGGRPAFICRANLGVEGWRAGVYTDQDKKCTIAFKPYLAIEQGFDILVVRQACGTSGRR